MNKIKIKDWADCLGNPYRSHNCKIEYRLTGKLLRCPDKATGERPANCPLPVVIEFEKEPVAYDEKEHGTLPIL